MEELKEIVFGFIFSLFDSLFVVLLGFIFFDYITGVLKAIVQKKLSSELGAKGISHKILIFIVVAMSKLIDQFIIGNGDMIRTSVTIFYICNEGISILENAVDVGLPIPDNLKSILKSNMSESNKQDKE